MNDSKYLSCAETAKLVRASLKRSFPGVKFSVRADSYSMGAHIDVRWADGPPQSSVKKVVGAFAGSGFDGMIDLKYSWSSWLLPDGSAMVAKDYGTEGSHGCHASRENAKPHPDAQLVRFGADSINLHRELSLPRMQAAFNQAAARLGMTAPTLTDLSNIYRDPLAQQAVPDDHYNRNLHQLVRGEVAEFIA